MYTYSDWRLIAPIAECPACGSTELRSRDHPQGMELGCRQCNWIELRRDDDSRDESAVPGGCAKLG